MATLKSNKTLKQKAEENTNVTRRVSREAPETVQKGVPLDHATKHRPQDSDIPGSSPRKVGISVGCTLNMENYESMRVDVWLTDEVNPGETYKDALDRVTEIAQQHMMEVTEQYR